MLRYLFGEDELVSGFAAALIPHCRRGFGNKLRTMGVIDDDQLIAGLVYHNYDPEAGVIEISGAATSPRWLSRRTLLLMHSYPFFECEAQMIVQRTPADNIRLLSILARYGYMLIKVPRLFGRDRDGVICLLTYEDWISNRFNAPLRQLLAEGQQRQQAEAA